MSDQQPVVIKKYANRRLYNTQSSRYIVAADVVTLIQQGIAFEIVDAKSGEDLTRNILNQIIFEQEAQEKGFLLPLEFQKHLILMYSDACRAMLPEYLSQAMQTFFDHRSGMAQSFQQTMQQNNATLISFTQKMAEQNQAYFQQSLNMFRAFTGVGNKTQEIEHQSTDVKPTDMHSVAVKAKNEVDFVQETGKSQQHELVKIKQQLAQLQQKVNHLEGGYEPD